MKTLQQFYIELQAWIDADCPHSEVFSKNKGICENLFKWTKHDALLANDLDDELKTEFEIFDSGSTIFPFNIAAGQKTFPDEVAEGTFYKNTVRLAFIRDRAAGIPVKPFRGGN